MWLGFSKYIVAIKLTTNFALLLNDCAAVVLAPLSQNHYLWLICNCSIALLCLSAHHVPRLGAAEEGLRSFWSAALTSLSSVLCLLVPSFVMAVIGFRVGFTEILKLLKLI
jgi:hypothetical protein